MIGIVLIQESKGGGLSSNFASSNQVLGVRKTTDFIEKATWGLAIAMVVLSVLCAAVKPQSQAAQSVVETEQSAPAAQKPAFPVAPTQNAEGGAPAGDAKAPAGDAQAPATTNE